MYTMYFDERELAMDLNWAHALVSSASKKNPVSNFNHQVSYKIYDVDAWKLSQIKTGVQHFDNTELPYRIREMNIYCIDSHLVLCWHFSPRVQHEMFSSLGIWDWEQVGILLLIFITGAPADALACSVSPTKKMFHLFMQRRVETAGRRRSHQLARWLVNAGLVAARDGQLAVVSVHVPQRPLVVVRARTAATHQL